jgi:DNA-binding CsgD family transcriptional regulator
MIRRRRGPAPERRFTKRQEQIARLLRKGYTQGAVAARLGIHPRTVEHHTAEMRRKMHAVTTKGALYPGRESREGPPPPPQRRPIPAQLRFRVLQRDNFACRYCGRRAPEVELHVDHVVPRSQGGGDEEENLVASCLDCNVGKGGDLLEPVDSVIEADFHN